MHVWCNRVGNWPNLKAWDYLYAKHASFSTRTSTAQYTCIATCYLITCGCDKGKWHSCSIYDTAHMGIFKRATCSLNSRCQNNQTRDTRQANWLDMIRSRYADTHVRRLVAISECSSVQASWIGSKSVRFIIYTKPYKDWWYSCGSKSSNRMMYDHITVLKMILKRRSYSAVIEMHDSKVMENFNTRWTNTNIRICMSLSVVSLWGQEWLVSTSTAIAGGDKFKQVSRSFRICSYSFFFSLTTLQSDNKSKLCIKHSNAITL